MSGLFSNFFRGLRKLWCLNTFIYHYGYSLANLGSLSLRIFNIVVVFFHDWRNINTVFGFLCNFQFSSFWVKNEDKKIQMCILSSLSIFFIVQLHLHSHCVALSIAVTFIVVQTNQVWVVEDEASLKIHFSKNTFFPSFYTLLNIIQRRPSIDSTLPW